MAGYSGTPLERKLGVKPGHVVYLDGAPESFDLEAPTTRISTWRMPLSDEDPRGIWHQRYYVPGTKMAAER